MSNFASKTAAFFLVWLLAISWSVVAAEQPKSVTTPVTIEQERHHLRSGATREWSRFPVESEGADWKLTFSAKKNAEAYTLVIRQDDVRMTWKVMLNGKEVGRLRQDENDMLWHCVLPAGTLVDGENLLEIEGSGDKSDDIMVGPVRLIPSGPESWLNEASVDIEVTHSDNGKSMPCRITIVDAIDECLVPIGGESSGQLAIRTGVVYSGDGRARFGLPAGNYRVYAGRGPEFGQASALIGLATSDKVTKQLRLGREVDTTGWVACDTHIHTVTHSGHGDASMQERMVTLAGEAVELAVATDHNKQIDYEPLAQELGLRQYFTPVIGNEVTTKFGHFNAFPFAADATPPDHRENNWDVLLPSIFATPDVQVVILNHARDVHSGYRPFGPENFNEASGDNLEGRTFRFNAMETLNSGAQQTDPLELFRDWMTLTNRGFRITPIGSSDSHDVNRYIVGQGRTYVRCDDSRPDAIDVADACRSIGRGHVVVSAGIFVQATVNDSSGPGDLASATSPQFRVDYDVRCPGWINSDRVQLYQNGVMIREQDLADASSRSGRWDIDTPKHDVFLTVLATGPGTRDPPWPIAQPYQPDSPDWKATHFGFTGAIRIDADGNGRFSSARDYANELVGESDGDFSRLISGLDAYDQAVAIQAAALWQAKHGPLLDDGLQRSLRDASPQTKAGFFRYISAWRESEKSRVESP